MSTHRTTNLPFLALPETVFFPHTFMDLELTLPHHQELFLTAQSQRLPVGVFLAKRLISEDEPEPYARLGSFGRIIELTACASGNDHRKEHKGRHPGVLNVKDDVQDKAQQNQLGESADAADDNVALRSQP